MGSCGHTAGSGTDTGQASPALCPSRRNRRAWQRRTPQQAGAVARTGLEPPCGDWLVLLRGPDVLKVHSKAKNGKAWKSRPTRASASQQGQPPVRGGARSVAAWGSGGRQMPGRGVCPLGKRHSHFLISRKDKHEQTRGVPSTVPGQTPRLAAGPRERWPPRLRLCFA